MPVRESSHSPLLFTGMTLSLIAPISSNWPICLSYTEAIAILTNSWADFTCLPYAVVIFPTGVERVMDGPAIAPMTFVETLPRRPVDSRVTTSSRTESRPRIGTANSFTPLSKASLYSSRSDFHCARLSDNDVTANRPTSSPRPRNSCHLAAEPSSVTQGTGDRRFPAGVAIMTSSILAANLPAISSKASSLTDPAA